MSKYRLPAHLSIVILDIKMKSAFLCGLFALLAVATSVTVAQKEPNIDAILNNQYVLNGYIKCVLEQGKCNKMGEDLKSELHVLHGQWHTWNNSIFHDIHFD